MKKHLLFFFIIFSFAPALAQVRRTDPRPLHGLKKESLPPALPFSEIVKRAVPGGVLRAAQYVGKARIEPVEAGRQGMIGVSSTDRQAGLLWKVLRAANGSVNWMWRIGNPAATSERPQAIKPPAELLDAVKDILRIADPKKEFAIESEKTDELGMRHIRFKQVYRGIPVWKRDLYLHLDRTGEPSAINGSYEIAPKEAVTIPQITGANAILLSTDDLKKSNHLASNDLGGMQALGIEQPSATLVLYPENGKFRLAYDVDIHPNLTEHFTYLVDAVTGGIIRSIPLHCSLVPPKHVSAIGIPALTQAVSSIGKSAMPLAGFVSSSGVDLNGASRNFRSYQHTDNQYYMLWDLPSYNAGSSIPPNDVKGGGLTLDLRNNDASQDAQLLHVTSSNNAWSDPASVSAHANMNTCYSYYRTTFNRDAIDGKNSTVISIVHVTENGASMENAYWNGKLMLYGDGGTTFKPLAGALDVAGHEMTHGVTSNTADLVYEFQSGALNESFSDVFGVFIDNDDLTVGEDIMQPGKGTSLRNLENPADPNAAPPQPAHMNDFRQLGADQDNGGVHSNSGIPNRAAAIIINALGREKAQQIYYRALTTYLTRNSQFIDCRIACEKAAKDLGYSASDQQAVSNAFATVGIGGTPSDPNQDDVPAQTGGADYVVFIWENNSKIGFLQPDDPTLTAYEYASPLALARVTNTANGIDRCQLSAPRTGKNIYFVDPTGHLAYIEFTTGAVSIVSDLKIQQDGDVWNASISPDESYVAIASSYADDPNIYIFDGIQLYRVELLPQAPDAPSPQETIKYPDVMNWSPNKNEQRIAFDAYNEEDLAGGGLISYWSMYEINFTTQKIYSLVPAQPQDVNIGNVTYSKTDPDIIAFNVVDPTTSDVWIGNFESGDIFPLEIWKRAINSVAISDADRPSFSPNDAFICFTSAANNALCYIDGAGQVSYVAYNQALYNPSWILVGGSARVADGKAYFFSKPEVYPSITKGDASLRFAMESDAVVTVEIVNVLGVSREVFTGKLPAGDQEIALDLDELAAGAYLVRLTDGAHQAFTKLVIE